MRGKVSPFSLIFASFLSIIIVCDGSSATAEITGEKASELELSLFGKQPSAICKVIPAKSLSEGYPNLGEEFNKLLTNFKMSIQGNKPADLVPLFHARLKLRESKFKEILYQINHKLKSPLEVSTYHVYALNTPDHGSPLLQCGDDGMNIYPLYGNRLQFAAWIQLLGKEELGRIFIQVVPDREQKWKIGSFHYEQWTHASKNAQDWTQEALSIAEKQINLAYLTLDLASKLVKATPYFTMDQEQEINRLRERLMKKADWEKNMRSLLAPRDIAHLSSIFVDKGVGLSLRIRAPKEVPGNEMHEDCKKVWQNLQGQKELAGIKGVRCGFILPQENPELDGRMGFVLLQ